MKISREFKVGLVAIIALVILYWGINFLKGQDVFQHKKIFYAIYDGVDGLTSAKPVRINGLQVGKVEDVYFHPDGSGRIIVAMDITSDFDIPKSSTASIQSNFLGDKSIDLILGIGGKEATNGDTLHSQIELSLTEEVNKQVAPIKNKAEKLLGSIDTVLILVRGFLNEKTRNNFERTFSSIRRSFERLENTAQTLDEIVSESQGQIHSSLNSISKISNNLEKNNDNITAIFNHLNTVTDSLSRVNFKQTFQSLNEALVSLQGVMNKVNNGEGSLGKLVNDEDLYNNLEKASNQLDLLLLDIKYNPKRYINFSVFGKTQTYDQQEILKKEREEQKKQAKEQKKQDNK